MDTELLGRWDTFRPEKHGLFNDMKVEDAYRYIDEVIQTIPEEHRLTAYTAAYVMYNSVIRYYEENMICTENTKNEEE